MADIFDNKILCNKCNKEMRAELISRNGFNLRAVSCKKCHNTIIHPEDKREYEEFVRLKQKDYEVKMRMVGNSYAVSIPREIVDFMKEQEQMMDDMVKLSFEKAGRLSLAFNTPEEETSRIIKSEEVQVVKDGKSIIHAKKFSDSAHPEKNQTKIFKAKD